MRPFHVPRFEDVNPGYSTLFSSNREGTEGAPILYPGLKARAQAGHVKADPNPRAFLRVPTTHCVGAKWGGRLRLPDLCLSVLLWHARQSREPTTLVFTNGAEVEAGNGTFVVSMQTVAEVIGARLYGYEGRGWIEDSDGEWRPEFRQWYRRIESACDTLCRRGLIHKLGNPGGWRFNGTVWTFSDTDLFDYATGDASPETTDVVERARVVFLDTEDADRFRVQECCTDVKSRGLMADGQAYRESVEHHTPDQDRHQSIGATGQGEGVTVPWIVLDVDREGIEEAHEATARLINEIRGWDSEAMVEVAHTGGEGFHVRIPSGVVGNPVYKDRATARKALSRFAAMLTEEAVDEELFDTRHLVRMVGSRHHSGRYCTPFTVSAFCSMSLSEIIDASKTPTPRKAPDPLSAPVSQALSSLLRESAEQPFWVPRFEDVDETTCTPGAALRALEGCEEGEHWWPGHHGRSKAVFVAACHLLRTNASKAWEETVAVAGRCTPPLPMSEVKGCFRSAERTVWS